MTATGTAATAIITLSGVPAERTAAIELALEARSPETRRVYRIALDRLNVTLAGRPLNDATLSSTSRR